MTVEISLSLSTKVKPAKLFLVDGEEYKLLGLEHLTAETENEVMALFSRHGVIAGELEVCPNVAKGTVLAERLKKVQDVLISRMTNLPPDVVAKLPMMQKARLFEAIQVEVEADEFEEAPASAEVTRGAPEDDTAL
jgi:hypothetical protein